MSLTHLITASFLAMSMAAIADAQSGVKLSDKLMQSATMDAAAKTQVTAFIASSTELLQSSDPAQVRAGREMITAPMTKGGANDAFRVTFASMALPELKNIVSQGTTFQATNALEVIKSLQSPDSLAFLAEQVSAAKQSNGTLRLVAAAGIAALRTPIDLTTQQADAIVKLIDTSLAGETDWMIASYDLQALQAFTTSPRAPKASQNTAKALLLSRLQAMATQLRSKTLNSGMIRAINRSLALYLQNQIPKLSKAEAGTYTKSLEPTLKILKGLAATPPDAQHAEAYKQVGKLVDKFLTNIPASDSGKPATRRPSGL